MVNKTLQYVQYEMQYVQYVQEVQCTTQYMQFMPGADVVVARGGSSAKRHLPVLHLVTHCLVADTINITSDCYM